jgi:hypothetical protein
MPPIKQFLIMYSYQPIRYNPFFLAKNKISQNETHFFSREVFELDLIGTILRVKTPRQTVS